MKDEFYEGDDFGFEFLHGLGPVGGLLRILIDCQQPDERTGSADRQDETEVHKNLIKSGGNGWMNSPTLFEE